MTFKKFALNASVAVIALAVSGCSSLIQDELVESFNKSQIISAKCSNADTSEMELRKDYQQGMSNMILHAVHFSAPLNAPGESVDSENLKQLVDKVRVDVAQIYKVGYQAADPQTREKLDAISAQLKSVVAQIGQIEMDIRTASNQVLKSTPVTFVSDAAGGTSTVAKVSSDISHNIKVTMAAVTGDVAGLEQDLVKLRLAISSANITPSNFDLQNMPADQKQVLTTSLTDLPKTADSIIAIVDWYASGNVNVTFDPDSFKTDAAPFINEFVEYEAGRLMINAILRGSITVEHKLDTLDEKTWMAVSILEWIATPGLDYTFGMALKDTLYNTDAQGKASMRSSLPSNDKSVLSVGAKDPSQAIALRSDVLDGLSRGLFYAACQHVIADVSKQSAETARVDVLLSPLYEALITYAPDGEDGRSQLMGAEQISEQKSSEPTLQSMQESGLRMSQAPVSAAAVDLRTHRTAAATFLADAKNNSGLH